MHLVSRIFAGTSHEEVMNEFQMSGRMLGPEDCFDSLRWKALRSFRFWLNIYQSSRCNIIENENLLVVFCYQPAATLVVWVIVSRDPNPAPAIALPVRCSVGAT